jgi:hypothetical protein
VRFLERVQQLIDHPLDIARVRRLECRLESWAT